MDLNVHDLKVRPGTGLEGTSSAFRRWASGMAGLPLLLYDYILQRGLIFDERFFTSMMHAALKVIWKSRKVIRTAITFMCIARSFFPVQFDLEEGRNLSYVDPLFIFLTILFMTLT